MSIIRNEIEQGLNAENGEAILQQTIKVAKPLFNSRITACYALGSLAHGGFAPLVSDVDIAIILEDPITADDTRKIETIQQHVKQSGLPLAERLSIFWGSLNSLQHQQDIGRFPPLDKLDLIENGRLLAGKDMRANLTRPTHTHLVIMGAKFALELLATPEMNQSIKQPALLYQKGVRQLTKAVLFPVRLLYTSLTGKISHNGEAVKHYVANNHDKKAELVQAAFHWRYKKPENESEVIQLTNHALIELYIQFINEYHQKMLEQNETKTADDLMRWKQILQK